MRKEFVVSCLRSLIEQGVISLEGSMLAVCGGGAEREAFVEVGFKNVVISNLDDRMNSPDFSPYSWSYQDAQALSFDDDSFDYVFVSDGLHHCDSPHRALLEMVRVSRLAAIAFESRDSAAMRVAEKLGFAASYEVEAVIGNGGTWGGVNNSCVPNFVYRWTEREFEKTVNSYVPYGMNKFSYFYGLHLPYERLAMSGSLLKRMVARLMSPIAYLVQKLMPRQGNSFCMVACKAESARGVWPWLHVVEGKTVFNRDFV